MPDGRFNWKQPLLYACQSCERGGHPDTITAPQETALDFKPQSKPGNSNIYH